MYDYFFLCITLVHLISTERNVRLQDVRHYHSFCEMLEAESLKEVLPGVDTTEEGGNL